MLTIKQQIGYYVNENDESTKKFEKIMTGKSQNPSMEPRTFQEKIETWQKEFLARETPTEKYQLLISIGKQLPPLNPEYRTEKYLVQGCQSQLFIKAEEKEGKILFSAGTEALISAGLAFLLIDIYGGESLETILKNPPVFLQTWGLYASLSPNRAQGALHIYLKMQKLAILLRPTSPTM
jgi:cysteine desulfuration protein SufE